MSEEHKSLDLFGLKGLSDAIKIATGRSFDGAAAFLSRVCLPAAEEFGLALRDRVGTWRSRNAARMLDEANKISMRNDRDGAGQISPRIAHLAIEEASWQDEEAIQKMWAGLLASATSKQGTSDENLIFMNLLKQLSSLQVKILCYAVEKAKKFNTPRGLPIATRLLIPTADLPSLFDTEVHPIIAYLHSWRK